MSKGNNNNTSFVCAALVILGIAASICRGDDDVTRQFTDDENTRVIQAIDQYGFNYPDAADLTYDDGESGARRKRTADDGIIPGELSDYGSGKRDSALPKKTSEMGFKSRPGFRSWGGKRSKYVIVGPEAADPRIRRSKFNNWGGKRDTFRSWGGKRDGIPHPVSEVNSKFSNWGGKRFDAGEAGAKRDYEYASFGEKRAQFKSWGGKRFHSDSILRNYVNSILNRFDNYHQIGKKSGIGSKPIGDDSKYGFSAWKGKR